MLIFLFVVIFFISLFHHLDPPRILAYPIVGNSFWIISDLPYIGFQKLIEKYGDVFGLYLGTKYTVVVCSAPLAKAIISDNSDNFINKPSSIGWREFSSGHKDLFLARDNDWYTVRQFMGKSFTTTQLKYQLPLIYDQADKMIEYFRSFAKSNFNLNPKDACYKYSINIALQILVSKEVSYEEEVDKDFGNIVQYCEKIAHNIGTSVVLESFEFLKPLVYLYLNKPRNLMDQFILSAEELGDRDRISFISTDFIVAADSASVTILWFILLMVNNPDCQEKAFDEIKSVVGNREKVEIPDKTQLPYLCAVIKECQRYIPPTPFIFPRESKESIVINDIFIPKGANVLVNFYAMARNKNYWQNPDQFDPNRFMNNNHSENFLPFGTGPRSCIGMNLALDQLFIACSNILLNFKIKSTDNNPISEGGLTYDILLKPSQYEIKFEERVK
ncbi:cytochrome P450 family protein [Heterostelium album PN500]|uniref:Cytochrome P450 family protein n=1 Tax=Heterostelium pallidum (strain ATCC 26659 / Pp 5 / PN500) TaxID=670386 RepID=D3AZN7_HETP5|nr:cytochrome P450 family protein [Heterostelium album PN500]EFA85416.1 cytochrome P450 family protein [Heterostelium album PN500]|eukprot:XP_020437525.1 cytochrome P450 family protein [Heterostelium album PN500]